MILGLFPLSYSAGQTLQNEPVWVEKPGFSVVAGDNEKESVIGIFMDERYEYSYTAEGDLVTTHSMHQRFRLNTDEAVNRFNKLSVSLSDVIEVIEIKARVIKPDGNIIEFDKNNIKEHLGVWNFETFLNTCNYCVNRDEYIKVWEKDEKIITSIRNNYFVFAGMGGNVLYRSYLQIEWKRYNNVLWT
jgi:hypothetical protein